MYVMWSHRTCIIILYTCTVSLNIHVHGLQCSIHFYSQACGLPFLYLQLQPWGLSPPHIMVSTTASIWIPSSSRWLVLTMSLCQPHPVLPLFPPRLFLLDRLWPLLASVSLVPLPQTCHLNLHHGLLSSLSFLEH